MEGSLTGEDVLVDHSRHHDGQDEHGQQAMARRQHGEEIAVVHADLPDADQAQQPRPARRLVRHRDVAPVPALVGEADDEDEVDAADGEDEPEDDAPLPRAGDDEVAEEGPAVGGEQEERGPQPDLARVLVEEEHVFDVGEANGLAGCEGESHHRAEAVEGGEVGGQGAAEGEERAGDLGPEENGGAAPWGRLAGYHVGD